MNRNTSFEDIKKSVLTSKEVIEILGIKRSRLSQLVKSDKLTPIKKNIFLLEDVIKRKEQQEYLREKYYRPVPKINKKKGE